MAFQKDLQLKTPLGFTLIEMIMVMAVIGLLAVFAVNRGISQYQHPVAARKLVSDIQYAQQLAMTWATRCGVDFDAALDQYTVFIGTPATPVTDPIHQASFVVQYGSDVYAQVRILSADFTGGATLYFDSRGRPYDNTGTLLAADGSVVLTDADSNDPVTITVSFQTGFARVS